MFEKYVLSAENYQAEYNTFEDAKKAARKLGKYYDEAAYNIWGVTYDSKGECVDCLLMDSEW